MIVPTYAPSSDLVRLPGPRPSMSWIYRTHVAIRRFSNTTPSATRSPRSTAPRNVGCLPHPRPGADPACASRDGVDRELPPGGPGIVVLRGTHQRQRDAHALGHAVPD